MYLRRVRLPGGGWPLHHDGAFNMSASVKAYFALKAIGDSPAAPHMREAREAILAHGGAEQANVFTRILLALFGVLSWSAVPVIPVEVMYLPTFAPFHLSRISYWGRTVLVPLLVLAALKPMAQNPRGVRIDELFVRPPMSIGRPARAAHQSKGWFAVFATIDAVLRVVEPVFPRTLRRRAIDRAVAFVTERLNGDSGLGAIFPAMANTVMMFEALGYPRDHPHVTTARAAIERLVIDDESEAYCQPCVSPVWDTALASHALLEVDDARSRDAVLGGMRWLVSKQVLDVRGDWIAQRPDVRPGGWAFQYDNPHYPDLDDTAAVVLVMHRFAMLPTDESRRVRRVDLARHRMDARAAEPQRRLGRVRRGQHARVPEQHPVRRSRRAARPADRGRHGALRRHARAATATGPSIAPAMERGLRYLGASSCRTAAGTAAGDMNYLYGTWSVLCGLTAAGFANDAPEIRRAVAWLLSIQNDDGGWGEDAASYELDERRHVPGPSTASQTAWALLGLMAAGEVRHDAVARGIDWLMRRQGIDGFWAEPQFTATGFPRVFYLRYHGYPKFFPLWALARYRRLTRIEGETQRFGL